MKRTYVTIRVEAPATAYDVELMMCVYHAGTVKLTA